MIVDHRQTPVTPLSEVCSFKSGGTPDRRHEAYYQGETPWVSSADFDQLSLRKYRRFITREAIERSAVSVVERGTVLIVSRTSVGRVGVALDRLAFSQDITAVLPDKGKLDSSYLRHFLSANAENLVARARGATIQGITRQDLGGLRIPLPPLEEQRRIAAILDQADALRDKRRQALAQVEKLTQSVFLEMFGGMDVDPVELNSVANIQGGLQVSHKRESLPIEVPYLRVANVGRGILELGELKTIRVTETELQRTRLLCNDLLLVEGHGNENEVGRCARWTGNVEPCLHQNHLIRVRCGPRLNPVYAAEVINGIDGRKYFRRAGKTTSGLNTISTTQVKGFRLPLPPLNLQQEFARRVEAIERLKDAHRRSLGEMDALFASLQHRAFRGEL